MLQQVGFALTARAYFKSGKTGKTGLTVTVNVWAPDGTALVSAGACTEIGDGVYQRILASGSVLQVGEYTFVFKTTDTTVNQKELAMSYSVGYTWLANIDAAVSSRLATGGYTAPDNADIVAILARTDVATSTRLAGNAYTAPDNADIASILARTDVATSTRLAGNAYTAPDNAGISTLLDRLTSDRADLLDNLALLDAAISSRLATLGYTAPDNADIAAILARTDVATSTRLATAGYTAPDNADIAAILARTDVATSTRLATAGYTAPDNDGIAAIEANVDVATSTRLAAVDYTAPDNADISSTLTIAGLVQEDTAELLTRLSEARAELLDGLVLLDQLGTVNDRLAAILALPDVAAVLSQRTPATLTDDITGYTYGDSVTLARSLLEVPTGEALVKVWLTVKERLADTDEDALLQLYVTDTNDHGAGVITDNGQDTGTGSATFTLTPDDTIAIGLGRRHYDIQGLTDGGTVKTFYRGLLTLYHQVTIADS